MSPRMDKTRGHSFQSWLRKLTRRSSIISKLPVPWRLPLPWVYFGYQLQKQSPPMPAGALLRALYRAASDASFIHRTYSVTVLIDMSLEVTGDVAGGRSVAWPLQPPLQLSSLCTLLALQPPSAGQSSLLPLHRVVLQRKRKTIFLTVSIKARDLLITSYVTVDLHFRM